jgi:hypothetical protein
MTIAAQSTPLASTLATTTIKVPVNKAHVAMHLGVPVTHPVVAALPTTFVKETGFWPAVFGALGAGFAGLKIAGPPGAVAGVLGGGFGAWFADRKLAASKKK